MTFREDYAAAAEDLEEYFGEAITYADPATVSTPVQATVHQERRERRKNSNGGWDWITVRDVIFFEHTIPSVTPRHDAEITIDGELYAVLEITTPSPGRTQVKVQRAEATEVARRGYRGR